MPTINKYTHNKKTRTAIQKNLLCIIASLGFYSLSANAENIVSCNLTAIGTVENANITATTAHLTDNFDGTVSDSESGLIWKKCSEGQGWSPSANTCKEIAVTHTWQAALQLVQAINAGATGENFSQEDWRLPNIKELKTIVERRCAIPAINNTVFPNTSSASFWSSSPYAPGSGSAWSVNFFNGSDGASRKSNGKYVRLVRSGQ